MTDDEHSSPDEHGPTPPTGEHVPPEPPSANGPRPTATSPRQRRHQLCARVWPTGATRRWRPSALWPRELAESLFVIRSRCSSLLASIGLAIAFATLLGDIKPASSGAEVPLTHGPDARQTPRSWLGRAAGPRQPRGDRHGRRGAPALAHRRGATAHKADCVHAHQGPEEEDSRQHDPRCSARSRDYAATVGGLSRLRRR